MARQNKPKKHEIREKLYIKWRMIIVVMYATFSVAKRKPEKNSGLYGILTFELCDTGAALSQQANGGQVVRLSFRNCKSCVHNCDDHPSFNSSLLSSHIWVSHIFITSEIIYLKFAPCMGIRILQPGKFLHVESRIQHIFSAESGIQLKEHGIPLPIGIQSKYHWQRIRYPVLRISNPRLSCRIPLHGTRNRIYTGAESLLA